MAKLLEATQTDKVLSKLVVDTLKPHIAKVDPKFKPIDVVVSAKPNWETLPTAYLTVAITYKYEGLQILGKDITFRVEVDAISNQGSDDIEFDVEGTGYLLFDGNSMFGGMDYPVYGKILPKFSFSLRRNDIIK